MGKNNRVTDLLAGFSIEHLEVDQTDLSVSNEGFTGAAIGFVLGMTGPFFGGYAGGEAGKLKKEIDSLTKQIKKVSIDNGKQAVKDGKLSASDFKKVEKMETGDIVTGAALGYLAGPLYGAIKGSEIQNLNKELKDKLKELDAILVEASRKQGVSVEHLSVSNEGFTGAAVGFVLGMSGFIFGGYAGGEAARLKKEIDNLTKEIKKVSIDGGKQAVKEGKLSASDFKKIEKMETGDIVTGAALGWFGGPIYGAYKGSQIQNLNKELKDKLKELDAILVEAAQKQGVSQEDLDATGEEVLQQVEEVEDRVEDVEEQVEEVEETVDEHLTDPDAHSEVEAGEGADPIGGEVGETELDLAVVDEEAQASEEVVSVQDEVESEVAVLDEASEIVSNTAEVVEGVDVETDDDSNPVEEIDTIVAVSNERLRLKLGDLGKDLVFNTTSLEGRSFKSVQGRLMAKELALENLNQQQKGIFAKAIEAIKKAWEWIATRVKELWIKLTGTKRRREKIVAFLKENPVKQKVVVENAQLAQRLGITRSNNVYSDVVDTIANLVSAIDVHAKTSAVSHASILKDPNIEKTVVLTRQLLNNTVLSLGGFGTLSIKLSESSGVEFFNESRVDIIPPTGKFVDSINTLSSDEVIKLFSVLDNSLKRIENDEIIKHLKQGKPDFITRGMANLSVKLSGGRELSDSEKTKREALAALGNYTRLFTTPLSRMIGFLGQLDISVTMLGELTVKVAKGKEADVKSGAGTSLAVASEGISSTEGGPGVLTDDKDYEAGNDYDLNEGEDPGEFKNVKLEEGEIEQTEIGTVSAAIEQFEEMAEVLEEAGEAAELHDQTEDAIEAALSGNGLDETAATFMDIAAEAIHGRMLRLDREYTPTLNRKSVSLENFRKSAYRLEATSVSLEDWKETGKGIIEAIKKALAKVVAMIRYVYKQAKTYFKGAEGRVERLRRRLQATPDTKMSPKPINDEKFLARFRVGNKALNPSTANEGLDQLAKTMDAAINDSLTLVSAGEDIIKGKAAEASRVLLKFNTTNELIKLASVKEKDGSFIYTVDGIPGGSEIVITRPKLEGELIAGFKATVTKKTEGRVAGVVRTLSKSDAKKVLSSVSTALTKADNTSKELDSLVKMVEDITKGIKDEDFNDSKARSAAKKAVAGLSRVSSGEVFTVIKAQGMAIDTILTWVAKSIGGGDDSTKGNDSKTPLLTQ